jgi:hypothetical protein
LRSTQLKERALIPHAPGWGIQLTNCGNCAFQDDANRSIDISHLDEINLNSSGSSCQSLQSGFRLDWESALTFKYPCMLVASKQMRRDSHHL